MAVPLPKTLRCEKRGCTATTDNAQVGLIAGEGWRIQWEGEYLIIVCPRHNWDSTGRLVHGRDATRPVR